MELAFGRLTPKDSLKLTAVFPLNVSLSSAPHLSTDEKTIAPVDLPWQRCVSAGCVAELEVTAELLKQWRGQTEHGRVEIKNAAGKDVTIPFSFRGLAQALDALAKS
jgi:invasion protein IalB